MADIAKGRLDGPWIAERLSSLLCAATLDNVPGEVILKTKLHLLDFLGSTLAASTLEETAPIRTYGKAYSAPGGCLVIGSQQRADAEYASLINATVGHGFEMDDYAPRASTHPGCEVVPAAIAASEEVGATGAQLLLAVTYGFELAIRLGLATQPSMLAEKGFHESCVHGVISSAVAAGLIHQITEEQHVMALSIAASHASGPAEYARTGGEVKRLHAGLGGMGGIRAVRLAQTGLTGPPSIFEGTRGYLQAFSSDPKPSFIADGLGEEWEFMNYAALKPYYCVGLIHGHIDALKDLRRVQKFAAEDIANITLGFDRLSMVHCGAVGPEPTDMVGAQFSAEFSIAMNLLMGNGLDEYKSLAEENFVNSEVVALARRINLVEDEECGATVPAAALGKVTVVLRDGRTFVGRAYGRGSPSNPMTREEIEEKYRSLAVRAISSKSAERVIEAVMGLETLAAANDLTDLLVGS